MRQVFVSIIFCFFIKNISSAMLVLGRQPLAFLPELGRVVFQNALRNGNCATIPNPCGNILKTSGEIFFCKTKDSSVAPLHRMTCCHPERLVSLSNYVSGSQTTCYSELAKNILRLHFIFTHLNFSTAIEKGTTRPILSLSTLSRRRSLPHIVGTRRATSLQCA